MIFLSVGYLGLFAGTFLAATLLPLPSEGILIGAYEIDLNIAVCLAVATLGNFFGGLTNYYIGYKCNNQNLLKKFKFNETRLESIKKKLNRWGYWLGLLSWLPFVGDPMLLVLGFYKTPLVPLMVTMLIGKFMRYFILTLIYLQLFGP